MSEKGTSLAQYVEHFGLEILNHGDTYETDKVESTNVNRPDLQILGLFDYFDARRIQVMGKAELTYIMKMSENRRTKVFDDLFSYTIPALVLARNMECPAECLQCARNHGRTLLRTTERTADFTSHTMEYLSKQLAPCITRHGVLLDIYGEGVMITGDSGVGKSESAIELIMRGHRLVADDAVEIRLVADQLIGTAPEVTATTSNCAASASSTFSSCSVCGRSCRSLRSTWWWNLSLGTAPRPMTVWGSRIGLSTFWANRCPA